MKTKKRVLHILASNIFSGAENIACTIIEKLGDDYEMAYCSPNGIIKEILKNKNIYYYEIDKLSLKNIKKVINEFQPDIIHAHDFKATFFACMFSKKCEIVSHIHKNDPSMKKISIKSILYLLSSKRIKNIFGVSDSIFDEYIFKNRIKNKYITLYNYIDKDKVSCLANEYNVDKKYDLFYFGRLNEEKNPIDFIEIVNRLKKTGLRCVMIGDGDLKNKCEQLIKEYDLEKVIDMVGFKSNPFPYIKNSSVGIMPSKYEGFGITAIESLVLSKPVLNSGIGGLKKIFENNPEFICKNIEEYIEKIKEIDKYPSKNVDISNYTNLTKWKKIIEKVYGGGKNE